MSTSSTFLTPELNAYIAKDFSAEDAFLHQLLAEAEAAGIPPISIAAEQASFLQVLLRAIGAKRVVEIGSLAGYSAIVMARALPADGVLHAFELNPEYCAFIERKAKEAGLGNVITVHPGKAVEELENSKTRKFENSDRRELEDGTVDVVFIDADKPNYSKYFELVFPLMRKGGLIIGDNALAWGHVHEDRSEYEPNNVVALRAFNDLMSTHPGIQATLVPLGDGMVIGLVL